MERQGEEQARQVQRVWRVDRRVDRRLADEDVSVGLEAYLA